MYHIQDTDNIRQALDQHGVVCIHKEPSSFTPNRHILLAEELGEIEVTKFFRSVPSYPNIALVEKKSSQKLSPQLTEVKLTTL